MIMLVADAEIGCHAQWVTFLLKFTVIKQLWVTVLYKNRSLLSSPENSKCINQLTVNSVSYVVLNR